ncbi:hypothetical protein AERO_00585 [Aeromicrobium fastidiosum]|uniref:hypothetical protein n=1 Tax=Aeromicrobium fastidiosum TaxID=52699 RepID=UPI0020234402|nr:hypothetical protein [Aeromicrobium fastidiosum]MCL8249865.1 hypothetical protein [Aeromicrobium fastidiosum]
MTPDCRCSCSSHRRRRGVSFVLTCVLLFTALGSTAFAAGSLARNSVGTAQIKKNAVVASKLRAGSVGSSEIQDGSVNGTEVADNSLGGADLADGSVTGADLADASVGGRKIAANSIGLQAVEQSTQDHLTNVPMTQVVPDPARNVSLNLNPGSLVKFVVTPAQAGLNLLQSQVTVRSIKSTTITCDIAVDGAVLTRVKQSIIKTDDLQYAFATIPLTATTRLLDGQTVVTRCTVGQASIASAMTADPDENGTTRATTMVATRVAR